MSGFLSPYRVLDLSDERGLLAGHMLGRLGADVVQVEPLGGNTARACAPFDPALPDGDNSFYWSAWASAKRGLACDLDRPGGQALLHRLLSRADFLIESADPAQRQAWGITPAQTAAAHPALVHVSVSAFGTSGPKAYWPATDLTVWAAGGPLLPNRDGDRAPLRISVPQTWQHAAGDAAAGALIAHFARLQTGRGQHVDVSAQASASICTLGATLAAQYGHPDFVVPGAVAAPRRGLDLSGSGSRTRRSKWRVKDGLVEMHIGIGPAAGRFANNLFRWLASEGACDADVANWDWVTLPQRVLAGELGEADLERARNSVARFFAKFTKEELLEQAMARRLLCAPVATPRDLLASRQLAQRGYFQTVTEASGARRTLPGAFHAGVPQGFAELRPAPSHGQHSNQVLADWLAMPPNEVAALRAHGVIA